MLSSTRRAFLCGSLSAPLLAQAPFPGVQYRNYARCLPDYLRGLASSAYKKREAALARITSPLAARERQAWVRRTLVELIGGLPERTELNPQVIGALSRSGYRLERVIYESRPKLYISANLYVPTTGPGPFPGVLFQLGHSGNGKAYPSYQRACQGLARLGYLVLAFDPMGQGERVYYPDGSGTRTRLAEGADEEHTRPGKLMLLSGSTCTQFQLWDAVRSLDYLASHPLVDSSKLASTGQSGGATLTMLLSAVDDRLKAAAVFSGNTENLACRNFLPPGSTDDAEQNFIGAGPLGFDRWDLLYPFAPKPMLISISDKDSFGTYSANYVSNGWEEYQKLARTYSLLGAQQHLSWTDTPLPHGLSYDSRLRMYNWFERHLKRVDEPVREEPPVTPEPDTSLWVSESGNIVRSFGGETSVSVARRSADSLTPKPVQLSKLLGVEQLSPVRATVLKAVPSRDGITVEAVDIPVSSDVHLPAWIFRPKQSDPAKPALLLLHSSGRNAAWGEDGLCQQLAAAGITVCAPDVRGIGDLSPEFSSGAPGYARAHASEEDYAWSSLILGKPLLGQRVTDILAAGRALNAQSIAIAAFGQMTIPALFAAALDPKFQRIYLAGGLTSYQSILDIEDYTHTFADFVPNLLAHTDLPGVVAQLAPRRVVIAGAVDAKGGLYPIERMREMYRAKEHVELRQKADWTMAALAGFCA